MKFFVEYVQATKVIIEADSLEEAGNIAIMADCEDIAVHDPHSYMIVDIRPAWANCKAPYLYGGE